MSKVTIDLDGKHHKRVLDLSLQHNLTIGAEATRLMLVGLAAEELERKRLAKRAKDRLRKVRRKERAAFRDQSTTSLAPASPKSCAASVRTSATRQAVVTSRPAASAPLTPQCLASLSPTTSESPSGF